MRSAAPSPPLRGILFDAGFTLVLPREPVLDTYFRHAESSAPGLDRKAFEAAFRRAWASEREHPSDDLQTSDAMEAARWRRLTRLVAEPFPALVQAYEAWHQELVATFDEPSAWQLAPGAEVLLQALQQQGLKLAVVSNWHSALHGILEGLNVKERFAGVFTSAEIGFKKPHPRPFLQAVEALGLDRECVLHVGDSAGEDLAGAAAAGILAVHLKANAESGENALAIRNLSDLLPLLQELKEVRSGALTTMPEVASAESAKRGLVLPPGPPAGPLVPPNSLHVAQGLGRLGHELRNSLTVLYGIADELHATTAIDDAARNELINHLEKGIARTNLSANALFALRARILDAERVNPPRVAERVASYCEEARAVQSALDSWPALVGDARDFEAFLLKLALAARQAGGIHSVETQIKGTRTVEGPRFLVTLRFASDARIPAFWTTLDESMRALGGRMHRNEATSTWHFEFLAHPESL